MHTNLSLDTIAAGGLRKRFDASLERILENIQDDETDAKAKREMKVILKFKPAADRTLSFIEVLVESKLAAHTAVGTTLYMGFDGEQITVSETDPTAPPLFATEIGGRKRRKIHKQERSTEQ